MNQYSARRAALLGVLLASVALAACNRRDESTTVGQQVDAAKDTMVRDAEQAKAAAGRAVTDATQATGDAARAAGETLSDTAITARIKASLLADTGLKLLDVSVETQAGRAVLRGTAPNAAARDQATQLAGAVPGVVAVDNQLAIAQ